MYLNIPGREEHHSVSKGEERGLVTESEEISMKLKLIGAAVSLWEMKSIEQEG